MAYLEGLLFQTDSHGIKETRSGVPAYNGSAGGLSEWRLKVLTKKAAIDRIAGETIRAERLSDFVARVTEGLTDNALKVAMDLGEAALIEPGGLRRLVDAIEADVVFFKEDEARDLFQAGTMQD